MVLEDLGLKAFLFGTVLVYCIVPQSNNIHRLGVYYKNAARINIINKTR